MTTRRAFIKKAVTGCAACGLLLHTPKGIAVPVKGGALDKDSGELVEARHYDKLEELKVRCVLCPKECSVADRERGYCGVRENREGTYYTLVHSRPCSVAVDPIEKKPLFHFLPGSKAFSIATVGCNMECKFCQNWEISQFTPEQRRSIHLPPDKVAAAARGDHCKSIAYTYTEPVVFYEYMYDCAVAAKKLGVKSVMISNGYIQEKPLRQLIPALDAVKIDLKAFTNAFYKDLCSGELDPVLKTLKILNEKGIWFEIVVLIIPTKNDSPKELKELCTWVVDELSDMVPIHFTRFRPIYKIKDLPPTPISTLTKAYEIARSAGINFPYIGNVVGHDGECTFCPNCSRKIITRRGFYLSNLDLEKGNCVSCGTPIPGVWQ